MFMPVSHNQMNANTSVSSHISSLPRLRYLALHASRVTHLGRSFDHDSNAIFSIYDGLGITLALTNQAASSVVQYSYEPFGKTQSSNPSFANPFQFTGRENDNTGLSYYRARYYSPSLHRFLAEDPFNIAFLRRLRIQVPEAEFFYHVYLSEPLRRNAYSYVGNSPTNYVDPLGLLFWNSVNAGEGFGEDTAQYWADLAFETGNPLYNIPGLFASLWTRKTSDATLATLAGGYFARLTTPGGDIGTPKFLQRLTRPYIRLVDCNS